MLREQELRQLMEGSIHKGNVLVGLVEQSEYVAENQSRIVPDEVCVPEAHRVRHLIQHVLGVHVMEERPPHGVGVFGEHIDEVLCVVVYTS